MEQEQSNDDSGELFVLDINEEIKDSKKIKRNDLYAFEHPLRGWYDVTHAYVWDKSDFDIIYREYRLIRHLDSKRDYDMKRNIIANMEKQFNRMRNDQSVFDFKSQRYIKNIDFIEKHDRITNAGRTRAAELIAGEAANRFDYAMIGTSQTPVSDSDYQLFAEVNRINLKLSGYASASGAIIKHSALWTPGLPSNTYWEFAPVDLPAWNINQMIWARVVFPPTRGLVHQQNADFFTITHSTYTSSLA